MSDQANEERVGVDVPAREAEVGAKREFTEAEQRKRAQEEVTVYHATGGFAVKVKGRDRAEELVRRGTHTEEKPNLERAGRGGRRATPPAER